MVIKCNGEKQIKKRGRGVLGWEGRVEEQFQVYVGWPGRLSDKVTFE